MKIDMINMGSYLKNPKRFAAYSEGNDFFSALQKRFMDIDQNLQVQTRNTNMHNPGENAAQALIKLGTISQNHPTVSDLLIKNPQYRNQCWQIIHSVQNQKKPFTRIQAGTEIFIDPNTHEIVWKNNGYESYYIACENKGDSLLPHEEQSDDYFSEKLADAVIPFIGQPYDQVDCYELIVNGLKKLGVQYYGNGGLKEKLVKRAAENGFSENALLTGEGLVKVTGKTLYEKSISVDTNSEKMMQDVLHSLEPMLKRGQVLSFSTPSRGHTGIISGRQGFWTYINSGRLDHHIGESVTPKGVGEESLADELRNWFRLAIKRDEPLQITLGQLDAKKLVMLPQHAMQNLGRV